MTQQILRALETLRLHPLPCEYTLHDHIAACLRAADIPFQHEAPIAPRRRIDFLCGRTGIEVKRGKPSPALLKKQLEAYAQSPHIDALILVVERSVYLPPTLAGKPVVLVSLNRLWGIALA